MMRRSLPRPLALLSLVALFVLVLTAATLLLGTTSAKRPDALTATDSVDRGAYLVNVIGCNDCHTPFKMGPAGPEPDMSRMLSGHPESVAMPAPPALAEGPWMWTGAATNTAFAGPWGVSYASNLTPDKKTGIGIWSQDTFFKSLRTGRHWGQSRPILPPMPWQSYARLTDDDLAAIYVYLQSIPPVANRVPDSVPAESPPAGPAS